MKKTLAALALLLLALAVPTVTHAAPATAPAVPDIVTKGFDAYKKSSADAIDTWFLGSPMEKDVQARVTVAGNLGNFEKVYGAYLGWELIKVVPITASTEIVYAVAKFEKGPLWIAFNCYKAADQWTLPSIRLNQSAENILPQSILSGE